MLELGGIEDKKKNISRYPLYKTLQEVWSFDRRITADVLPEAAYT
jgi:hypothetical protein